MERIRHGIWRLYIMAAMRTEWIAVAWAGLIAAGVARGTDVDGQKLLREAAGQAIKTVPATQPAADFTAVGLQSFFYAGPGWHGEPTRVFAWFGLPSDYKMGEKVPAMLLVHGGGGTAFASWVRIWNQHGYAALAIDTAGQVPSKPAGAKAWDRDEQGGPRGWGGFDQVNDPIPDQWPFQAEMDVILG